MILQPELSLSKVNADDVTFCCWDLFIKPGLEMVSEQDGEYIFFSQHSRKPNVTCIAFVAPNYFDVSASNEVSTVKISACE